ncbi:MAG: DUF4870 domain-containing protein [Acidimicrobiia bacterium]
MTPAGWYPDPFGRYQVRYWDGEAWTANASTNGISAVDAPVGAPMPMRTDVVHVDPNDVTSEDKTWAVLSHVLGWLIALIALLVRGNERPFVRDQAVEALNFDITIFIGMIVSVPLMFVLVGFFTFFGIAIAGFVLHIVGAVEASKGVRYRYPINIRLIK